MDELQKRLRHKAMDWLAQREYSRHELAAKLKRRFAAAQRQAAKQDDESESAADHLPLDAVLDWLEQQQFLSDERCAKLFVRSHINRGHGPLRIRQELVFRKGLAQGLVEAKLQAADCDWFALATQTLHKRFRKPPQNLKEKARQLRFLQSRGFAAEQCYQALESQAVD